MRIGEMLIRIREPWLSRLSHSLSKGEGSREYLEAELNRFYDLLLEAVNIGDPSWLRPILVEWSTSRTETELLEEDISIAPILNDILMATITVSREKLDPLEALELTEAVMPIFMYAYNETARQEMVLRLGYVTTQLEIVQRELERIDRSKSDFISIAAHELKTPLTLIEGYADMLREQFSGDETGMADVYLKGIDNGTLRLGEIVNDMIDVSMIDNNLLSLNFQPTWVDRLLDVLEKEVRQSVNERGQKLEIIKFEGCTQMTFADSERLYQAFRNVLTNAIKYTPDGGSIVIDGRQLEGFLEVTVKDSGIGIDPDDQVRIFEKFGLLGNVSLHSSGKTKFKGGGPGLGLPITKGILEAHGGTIWVESEGYNEEELLGATFHILLPLVTEPPDEKLAKLFQPIQENSKS